MTRYIIVDKSVPKDPKLRGAKGFGFMRYMGTFGWSETITKAGPFPGRQVATERLRVSRGAAASVYWAVVPLRPKAAVPPSAPNEATQTLAEARAERDVARRERDTAVGLVELHEKEWEAQRDILGAADLEMTEVAAKRVVQERDASRQMHRALSELHQEAVAALAARPIETLSAAAARVVQERDEALEALKKAQAERDEQQRRGNDWLDSVRSHDRAREGLRRVLGAVAGETLEMTAERVVRERDDQQPKLTDLLREPAAEPPAPLVFEVGDVWEWTDASMAAAHHNQYVGWPVRVSRADGRDVVIVDLVGAHGEWRRDATDGLKLIERRGKPYGGPRS